MTNNSELGRFELIENNLLAFAEYRLEDGVLVIPHVEADPALRGTGAAGRLMDAVIAHARAQGLKINPLCGYAAAYIRRSGAQELLA